MVLVEEGIEDKREASVLSVVCLVAGTCMGGGMLALPVATGVAGFFPSILVMIVCWITMTASALFLLEASLWMDEGAHVISMAKRFLGNWGRVLAWTLYLFICYASVVAYTAGGGAQVTHALRESFQMDVSKAYSCTLFLVVFGSVLYLGNYIVGRVNTILFMGMIGAYFALVILGVDHVDTSLLQYRQWKTAWLAIPLFLTSFSFQTMVPSLTPMLKRNASVLRWAIIGGTTLTFAVYLVWEWLVLGIVPVEGPTGLAEALARGEPATHYMKEQVGSGLIYMVAEYFAFFALVTSFLGIAMGLFDFLSDGLRIRKDFRGKIILTLLIAIPTLFFAVNFERAFLVALDTSGGYGDSILNGIMPVAMVWIGRYHMGLKSEVPTPGGKVLLIAVGLFFLGAFLLEVGIHSGLVPLM
ncbi:MAG: aromatic amino acid transport family protein [Chlamydiales bacterium]|nr:aromatic amino acid transport family protein [Chlamydiales bacterium]